ncbi:MAG: hypothetical protein KDI51_06925 [Xanthomonadales bacterium]|nr:hypothetical protein [Xanthomonadales bacterium]
MEVLIYSIFSLAAGAYFLVRNIRLMRDENALREYLSKSPKALVWVQKYGVEGAMRMARDSSLRLGLVMAVGLMVAGGWWLWHVSVRAIWSFTVLQTMRSTRLPERFAMIQLLPSCSAKPDRWRILWR